MNNKTVTIRTDAEDNELWREYVDRIREREVLRKEGQKQDKIRNAAWRKFFLVEGRIAEVESALGVKEILSEEAIDVTSDAEEEPEMKPCPGAPKKAKRNARD